MMIFPLGDKQQFSAVGDPSSETYFWCLHSPLWVPDSHYFCAWHLQLFCGTLWVHPEAITHQLVLGCARTRTFQGYACSRSNFHFWNCHVEFKWFQFFSQTCISSDHLQTPSCVVGWKAVSSRAMHCHVFYISKLLTSQEILLGC